MSRRPIIGLDLDEVEFFNYLIKQCLGEFNKTIAQFYNLLHGTHLTINDFHSFKYWEVWGGTAEEVYIEEVFQYIDISNCKTVLQTSSFYKWCMNC